MKLGYFTMPLRPVGKDWRQTLAEDRGAGQRRLQAEKVLPRVNRALGET